MSFEATSIMLATFMARLSSGGFAFAHLAARTRHPLRLYGALEIAMIAFAPGVPWLLRTVYCFYANLTMEAGHMTTFGTRLSWLYGVNTLGAVVGAVTVGFALIPVIGVWRT